LTLAPLTGIINGSGTGAFSFGSDFSSFDFTQPILTTFNTNFSNIMVQFSITDMRAANAFVLLDTISDFSFNSSNLINRNLSYTNFSGGYQANFNTNLSFSLSLVNGQSGTAGWTGNAIITGAYSCFGSGTSTGMGFTGVTSGTMTGLMTGFDYAGSGVFYLSGVMTGYGSPQAPIFSTGWVNISNVQLFEELQFGIPMIYPKPGGGSATNIWPWMECYPGYVSGYAFLTLSDFVHNLSGSPNAIQNYPHKSFYMGGIIGGGNNILLTASQSGGATGNSIWVNSPCTPAN
jgi:hypothetical protein